jgi:hypothetical protein
MQLLILFFLTLLLDVFAYHLFIALLTDRADVIARGPKFSAPQFLLHFGARGEEFSCRYAFDDLYNLLRTVHWHRLHQKMHLVLVGADFEKRNFIAVADFHTDLFEFLVYFRTENHSTVLRWTNDVIHQYRDVMALMNESAHSLSIRNAASCGELTP